MEKIIDPVALELILGELTPEKKLCDTNKGGNEIYVVDAHDSPNLMREIGRLREVSFREAGGSSGLSADIDEFDTMDSPYRQIIVWDPDARAVIGGYRYILGPDIKLGTDGQPVLATSHMFRFSDEFIREYLPHTMELGRSFVAPDYQSSKAGAKALFAMDNLWDGIAAVMMLHPHIYYLFGKMTMYPSYPKGARDLILHFLWKHFPDPDSLVRPIDPVMPQSDRRIMDLVLVKKDFKDDYRVLKESVRSFGVNIPPMVNSYMNTSATMKMLGTAVNHEFSEVEETGILVCFNELYPDKLERHLKAYIADLKIKAEKRFPNLEPGFDVRIAQRLKERRDRLFSKFKKASKNSNQ